MISTDIADFFSNYPHLKRYFLGIFNVDTIRKNIPVNHFLICNTDLSSGPGQHWFVLFRYSVSELECFDSLAVGADRQTFLRSVKFRGIRELHYNQSPVQLPTSTTCGHFCLFFIFERLHNLDFEFSEFLNELFTENLDQNELIVSEFYRNHYNGFIN